MEELKEGYLVDFISGLLVKETPEEVEAVQPFSRGGQEEEIQRLRRREREIRV